jgi:hypothetical protein
MGNKSDVMFLASDLSPGDTIRVVCPRCNGGSSRESSLTITRDLDNSLVWNCFRDNCTEKGRSGNGDYIPVAKEQERKPVKRFEGKTTSLSEHRLGIIKKKWGIDEPPYWYWTPDYGGRIAMSVRSPKYMHRGWVLRDMRGVARSKALTYIDEGEVAQSWYRINHNAPTVVVEDIPSAVRVNMSGANAVALLGTLVNEDKAIEIARYAPRPIVIALDQDATAKAFQIARKFGLVWDDYRILPLQKDVKDMEEDDVKSLLARI